MSGIERFEDIVAWQKARAFVSTIYEVSGISPFDRDFPLKDQIRKAVISIPANIAEGFERYRPREFHQFLSIAKASCAEVRTYLYIAHDLGYMTDPDLERLLRQAEEVGRKIGSFRASIQRRNAAPSTQHSARSTQNFNTQN